MASSPTPTIGRAPSRAPSAAPTIINVDTFVPTPTNSPVAVKVKQEVKTEPLDSTTRVSATPGPSPVCSDRATSTAPRDVACERWRSASARPASATPSPSKNRTPGDMGPPTSPSPRSRSNFTPYEGNTRNQTPVPLGSKDEIPTVTMRRRQSENSANSAGYSPKKPRAAAQAGGPPNLFNPPAREDVYPVPKQAVRPMSSTEFRTYVRALTSEDSLKALIAKNPQYKDWDLHGLNYELEDILVKRHEFQPFGKGGKDKEGDAEML